MRQFYISVHDITQLRAVWYCNCFKVQIKLQLKHRKGGDIAIFIGFKYNKAIWIKCVIEAFCPFRYLLRLNTQRLYKRERCGVGEINK